MGNKSSTINRKERRDRNLARMRSDSGGQSSLDPSTRYLTERDLHNLGDSRSESIISLFGGSKKDSVTSDKSNLSKTEKEFNYLKTLYKDDQWIKTDTMLSNNHVIYLLNNSLLAPKKVIEENEERKSVEKKKLKKKKKSKELMQEIEEDMKKKKSGSSVYNENECPICFQEIRLNVTRCCGEGVCTDCFLLLINQFHLKNIGESFLFTSTTSALDHIGMNCPFCYSDDLNICYPGDDRTSCCSLDDSTKELSVVDDDFKLFSEGTESSDEEEEEIESDDSVHSPLNKQRECDLSLVFSSVKDREELEKKIKHDQDQALSEEGFLFLSEWENNFSLTLVNQEEGKELEESEEQKLHGLLKSSQLPNNNSNSVFKENNLFDVNQLEEFLVNQAIQQSLTK